MILNINNFTNFQGYKEHCVRTDETGKRNVFDINNFTNFQGSEEHNNFTNFQGNTVLEQMKLVNAMSLTLTILQISKATRNITNDTK